MSTIDAAYMAGIFDSMGKISVDIDPDSRLGTVRVTFKSYNNGLLQSLKQYLKFGVITEEPIYNRKRDKRVKFYTYTIASNANTLKVLLSIWKLVRFKKPAVELALEVCEARSRIVKAMPESFLDRFLFIRSELERIG